MSERTEPFSANEWRLFEVWLNYLDKGLSIAYELSQNGEIDSGSFGVSDAVTGVRWYATDLAVLDALVYRAAGRRQDESACFDQELSDVFDELDADHPRLRDLRNSLFAHPPFVDMMVGPDEVLFFTTSGVHVAPADGGRADVIIDPFFVHLKLPAIVERLRAILANRRATAEQQQAGETTSD